MQHLIRYKKLAFIFMKDHFNVNLNQILSTQMFLKRMNKRNVEFAIVEQSDQA
jgi:hypothetical protein